MKTLFFKEDRYLDNKTQISLIPMTYEDAKVEVEFDSVTYQLVKELPDDAKIIGYCEVSKHENKKFSVDDKKVDFIINNKVPVRKKKELFDKEIGFIKVESNEDTYIACVKKSYILLILLLLLMFMMCGFPFCLTSTEEPVESRVEETIKPGNDEKGNGVLEKEAPEFQKSPTFRMKINCTPTIEDGKIQIRLESPAEDNKDFSFVTEVYVLGEMNAEGELVESYAEPELIYVSPEIFADENVEYGTLIKEVEQGRYLGRALYKIYDLNGNLLTQTACKLSINSK